MDSAINVFDMEGQIIESFSKKGFVLRQIFHPTGIFVEESGLITVCDMQSIEGANSCFTTNNC